MDNAPNNDTFVRELAKRIKGEKGLEWDFEQLRFRCFGHILNIAVQAALNVVGEDIAKVLSFFI